MPEPRTLLSMAGAPPVRARPAYSALVLVDLQGEYRDGALKLDGIDAATAEAAALLATAREQGMPVIHVRHRGRAGGAFDPGGPHFALLPPVAAAEGEPTLDKALPNAFAGTDLADRLAGLGRKEILLAGAQTHMCIESTARAALDLGFKVAVVAAACATRDLPDPLGGPAMPAASLHRASLVALADRFATILPDAAAWRDGIA
jgi:nicotinamidase-related amidase